MRRGAAGLRPEKKPRESSWEMNFTVLRLTARLGRWRWDRLITSVIFHQQSSLVFFLRSFFLLPTASSLTDATASAASGRLN